MGGTRGWLQPLLTSRKLPLSSPAVRLTNRAPGMLPLAVAAGVVVVGNVGMPAENDDLPGRRPGHLRWPTYGEANYVGPTF